MSAAAAKKAEILIRDTGARVTQPRIRVLSYLLSQKKSLTHSEILERLPQPSLDSVTLYRVLLWLADQELVHRIAGGDQVWRFSAGAGHDKHEHAHFQCLRCDNISCFNDVALPRKITLPEGYVSQEINFLIKGLCPHCNKQR